ncbi:hypothetical protein [Stratiformator vulcanicus]|uniref:Uncharacterized protein n=1 Tax=Stratiformator vulcanicus TaxID=2527980 RepID=A0A517R7M2_9PLAN|nr:hypothetical protein [Stratiformator vulcanicus]QDT39821.1 hypothetical protein Pan189_42330 [Stratiformator vulcanicus]
MSDPHAETDALWRANRREERDDALRFHILAIATIELLTVWFYGIGLLFAVAAAIPLSRKLRNLREDVSIPATLTERFGYFALTVVVLQSVAVAAGTGFAVPCISGLFLASTVLRPINSTVFALCFSLGGIVLSFTLLGFTLWYATRIWIRILTPDYQQPEEIKRD